MSPSLITRPLADLFLHPALDRLARDIEAYCGKLQISVDELCPMVCRVLRVARDSSIIGNWPAYRRARIEQLETVPVTENFDLALDEPPIAVLRALTSVSRKGHEDPLLLGLIYRNWRVYEDCKVPLRPSP